MYGLTGVVRHTNCVLNGIWTEGNAGNSYASYEIYGIFWTQLNASAAKPYNYLLFAPRKCTLTQRTGDTNKLQISTPEILNKLLSY